MSLNDITKEVLALPKEDRIQLAQSLWNSVDDGDLPIFAEQELRDELNDRLRDEPNKDWKTHEQVMEEAKRKFGC